MTTPLARLDRVTRRFADVIAVDDVSLDIHSGQILGLLGPNGAGKSTLISLLQGLRRPSAGRVELLGRDPRDPAARQSLGSTPQETALPATLTVGEVIDFVGAHFRRRVARADLAEEFGLVDLLARQTGALSGGQRRRLSVALAFVGCPSLVLLDEPTTGLDVDARRALWAGLRRQHERGATIVVTSHYLEEIEALAERVVVLGGGRVLADDDLDAVLRRVRLRHVRLSTSAPERIAALGAESWAAAGTAVEFAVRDSDAFVTELVRSGIPFSDLTVRGASLEEAFLTLTAVSDPRKAA